MFTQKAVLKGVRTFADAIAGELRRSIMVGELQPGEKLWQDRLAERFAVSRIPVREALRQLAAEGLVSLHSHRSALVTHLTLEEVAELLAIADALETLAAGRGAPRLSSTDLDEMCGLIDQMQAAKESPPEWYDLNQRFHMVITRASRWTRLTKLVEESRGNVMRYVVDPEFHRLYVRDWHTQHLAIYKACANGEIEKISALLHHHWRFSSEAILDHLSISEQQPALA